MRLALPVLGWAPPMAHGVPVSLFGLLPLPTLVNDDADLTDLACLGRLGAVGSTARRTAPRPDGRTPGCQTCHGASTAHIRNEKDQDPRPATDISFRGAAAAPRSKSQACIGCHNAARLEQHAAAEGAHPRAVPDLAQQRQLARQRSAHAAGPGWDVSEDHYDRSRYGLQRLSGQALNLDASHAADDDFSIGVFASHERSARAPDRQHRHRQQQGHPRRRRHRDRRRLLRHHRAARCQQQDRPLPGLDVGPARHHQRWAPALRWRGWSKATRRARSQPAGSRPVCRPPSAAIHCNSS